MSELHYELESKETKLCTPADSATVLFLDPFGSRVHTMIWFPLEVSSPLETQPYHLQTALEQGEMP